MDYNLTEKEYEVLDLGYFGCSCESYYRYQCNLCKSIANGFLDSHEKEINTLEKYGLIGVGGYSYLKNTALGNDIIHEWKKSKKIA